MGENIFQIDKLQKPLLFDGAFGTYYKQTGGKCENCEFANLHDEQAVFNIHKEYIENGAQAIKTNTFGANSDLSPDRSVISKIIKKGYEIAASFENVTVFCDIGPISTKENIDEYIFIADQFLSLGACNFLFETFNGLIQLEGVFTHIKSKNPDANIIISFAVDQDGYTNNGNYYKSLISQAQNNENVDAVGLNCVCGPNHLKKLIEGLTLPLKSFSVMPNAGYPQIALREIKYDENTQYFAQIINEIKDLGVKILGGCCGTTPEHIRQISNLIENSKEVKKNIVQKDEIKVSFKDNILIHKSDTKRLIAEISPPLTTDATNTLDHVKKLCDSGVDAITVTDSPLARARSDSFMFSAKVKREFGIEVIPHLTCRDKNHIAIKGSLIGGKIEGINNVLAVTGDIPKTDRNEGVFNISSAELIHYISNLNNDIFADSKYFISGALNVNANNFSHELDRARKKLKMGAEYFLTQPVYSQSAKENLRLAANQLNCPVYAGLMPFAGYKNAMFIKNEVSGITIPDEIIELYKDREPDEVKDISVKICVGLAQEIAPYCFGYYLITPINRIDITLELIKQIRKEGL